jgi:hypothetical protein
MDSEPGVRRDKVPWGPGATTGLSDAADKKGATPKGLSVRVTDLQGSAMFCRFFSKSSVRFSLAVGKGSSHSSARQYLPPHHAPTSSSLMPTDRQAGSNAVSVSRGTCLIIFGRGEGQLAQQRAAVPVPSQAPTLNSSHATGTRPGSMQSQSREGR